MGSFGRVQMDILSRISYFCLNSFTCKELRLADTFKTFTDSTGKSFLSIRGMLFLSRHKLHPNPGQTYLRNHSDRTCFTQAASKASIVVGVRGGSCWWVMMAERVKREQRLPVRE